MFDSANNETRLKGRETEVVIGPCRPAVIVGTRITADLIRRDLAREDGLALVRQEAVAQAQEGAQVINVRLTCDELDQEKAAPGRFRRVVRAVAQAVPLPISIETDDPAALAAALDACPGKPLVNGISCREASLQEMLPLAVERGAAVVGVAEDDDGAPPTLEGRVEVGRHVLRMAITAGIARQDVIVDPWAQPLRDNRQSALLALETLAQLARIEAVNLTVRPQLLARGLPDGETVATVFGALAMRHGATCLFMDPAGGRQAALIADLLLAKDGAVATYVDYFA